jgi:serine/threonine-protein kinase
VADRFRVKRLLGVGGMGQVFEAFDERLERTIALKILLGEHLGSAKVRQRFEREAKVIARVRHPNVIEIFDYFPYGDDLVLGLEYSLVAHLRIGHGLAVTEVVRIGRGLLAGLGAIHEAGLVHRDIKPLNVLMSARDEPKIADLGIAHDSMGRSMTRTGARMGTPEYMSPEQIRGGKVDARTDLYACGILFYEALTGDVPFSGDSEYDVQEKHMHQPVDTARLAAKAPPGFVAMVEKALAKLPEHRWQSAEQMAKALTDGPTGGGEVRDRAREAQEAAARKQMQPANNGRTSEQTASAPGVTFRAAGLEWQTQPANREMTWKSAKAYAQELALAGGGWRLPTKDELQALYATKSSGTAAFPGMDSGWYWSSSAVSGSSGFAWYVYFGNGYTYNVDVGGYYRVRCVR